MKQYKIAAVNPFFIALLFTGLHCTAQTTGNKNLAEARKAIEKVNAIYFEWYAKNDGSILNLYTNDACLMPPNAPLICGRNALAKDFKDTYAAGVVKGGTFTTVKLYGDGINYVTEEGRWQVFDVAGKLIDDGKFLKLWKKTKAGWKILRDSFNSDHRQ